jgi:hypothetical protein
MKKSVIVFGFFLLVWTDSLLLLTWLDMNNFLLYLPRWLLYLAACALVLLFVPGKHWQIKLGLTGILLVWLLILPSLRWNTLKSFYIDCANIQRGMTLTEARKVMAPYVEADNTTGVFSAYLPEAPETPAEHNTRILFIPTAAETAEWCVVYPEEEKVKAVVISPD